MLICFLWRGCAKIEVPASVSMHLPVPQLGCHRRFPQWPRSVATCQLSDSRRIPDEKGGQSGIAQVQFGGLDQRFGAIRKPGFQQDHLPGCLDYGEPLAGGRAADAHVTRRLRSATGRYAVHWRGGIVVVAEVGHLQELAQVAFQIGRDVRTVKASDLDLPSNPRPVTSTTGSKHLQAV